MLPSAIEAHPIRPRPGILPLSEQLIPEPLVTTKVADDLYGGSFTDRRR